MVTICVKCRFYDWYEGSGQCTSDDAPYTDFVEGKKECARINTEGKCPYYSAKEGE